jgi:hypothetical protein
MTTCGAANSLSRNWAGLRCSTALTTVEMVRIAEELGRPIATPEETRQILKLGTWYDTPDETLFNLGLPPNRGEGQRGFLTYEGFLAYENDGRVHSRVVTPADPRDIL